MRRGLLLSLCIFPGVLAAQQPVANGSPVASAAAPTIDVARLTTVLSEERRKAFMVGMQLTPAQDSAFWPIFDKFEAERRVVSERMARTVQSYAQVFQTVSDDQAWEMTKATADGERDMIEVRRKGADELRKKMGGKVATRFWLLDDYLTTAVRLDVLDDLPILSASGQ